MKRNVLLGVALTAACCLMASCEDEDNGGTTPVPECPSNLTALQMLEPDAGDTLHVGVATTIKWCFPADVSLIQLDYTVDGGETWFGITSTGGVQKPTNTFSWTPPANLAGSSCEIRVAQYGETTVNAMSGIFYLVQ